jgi:beta-glucosidase
VVSAVSLAGAPAALAQDAPYKDPSRPVGERVEDLLGRMTLEEKVHQLATQFPNASVRLGIPHLKSAEALHGLTIKHATSFPQATAMGSTWDPALVERITTVIAREARAVGVHQVYSPMLGVLIDPRWGRSEESYSEDPYLASRIGVAFIRGLQGMGEERYGPDRIIATAKHFVADGQPMAGINATDMDASERRLHELFLPPFRAVVLEAQVGSIMPAHHAVNGIPMHAHQQLLQHVLRETWGFDGHIISDNNDIRGLNDERFTAPTWAEAARQALAAGVDQELSIEVPWAKRVYGQSLLEAVADEVVSVDLVDEATRNVLRSKFALGLFDDGTPTHPWQDYLVGGDEGAGPIVDYAEYEEIPNTTAVRGIDEPLNEYFNFLHRLGVSRDNWREVLYNPAHDELALEAARRAITLLENEGGLLPLDADKLQRVTVIGPNANAEILGSYSTPEAKHFVTVLDGIRARLDESVEVEYVEGCTLTDYVDEKLDYSRADIDTAVRAAERADVVVLAIGGNELTAKEGEDSDDTGLPGRQVELVRAVHATGTPVVVFLLHSRPLSIPWVAENIPAILDGWFLGQETGTAVAEALFGDINPGGKLPFSIPRNVGQIPAYYYWTYGGDRGYRDNPATPLYPFGHGLSYTSFAYGQLDIQATRRDLGPIRRTEEGRYLLGDGELDTGSYGRVSVVVKNVGSRAGDEVVQLYVRDLFASVVRPRMELKRFERISLAPGESRRVTFELGHDALAFYDINTASWLVEPGEFEIMVGSSSADIRGKGIFELEEPK